MQDKDIVDLYWSRDEDAIRYTDEKYGRMLLSLSFSLTSSHGDSEEIVNDTYLKAWNSMPQDRPDMLGAYLSKITRALSVDRYRRNTAEKRGAGAVTEELSDLIPSGFSMDDVIDADHLKNTLNSFLYAQSREKRVMFVKRYYMGETVERIAEELGAGESKVKMTLSRMRASLYELLKKEGLL